MSNRERGRIEIKLKKQKTACLSLPFVTRPKLEQKKLGEKAMNVRPTKVHGNHFESMKLLLSSN
jgi:hypothetical protein